MTNQAIDLLNIAQGIDAAELTDMTDLKTGGGKGNRLLPTGLAFVRLSAYVEYGNQPQEFNGKAKDPALEFRLGFTIVGGVGEQEGENGVTFEEDFVQGDHYPVIYSYDTAQTTYAKSKAVAMFNAVNTAPKGTHFTQKLGTLYTIQIGRYKDKKGKLRNSHDFTTLQPAIDPIKRKPYQHYENVNGDMVELRALTPEDVQVFLWNKPTTVSTEQYQAMWDSIKIEGTYEVKDADGNVKETKSKNFIQEKCLKALNFEGSSLQQLIGGVGLPSLEAETGDIAAPIEQVELEVPADE